MVAAFALVNLAELMLATNDAMMHLLPPTFLVALLFILLDCGACKIYTYIMKQGGKRAIGFYLIDKVVRLVFVVFLIIVYALADCSSLLAFSMSLLAFYLVSMVTSIIFYVKVEQNLSKKQ